MGRDLVFLPLTPEQAEAIIGPARGGVVLPGPMDGFAATPELYETFDLGLDEDEDAEHAALLVASVSALCRTGRRVVLVADLMDVAAAPDPAVRANGGVTTGAVPRSRCTAWFADEPEATVVPAAAAAAGLDLDAAWQLPEVQHLLEHHDLLWHGMDEPLATGAEPG